MQALTKFHNLKQLYIGAKTLAYRAVDASNKKVILKTPRTDQPSIDELAILQKEYQLLKQIDAPGIIQAFELMKHDQSMVLVLEDIDGQTLEEFLNKKPLPLEQFFKIALQLVDVLDVLHKHHIIHKDIKPENIIIEPKKLIVKLADFSISSKYSTEAEIAINPDTFEGTLAYISPEQTGRTHHRVDYHADYYSLGITFYEMLTGKLPFNATDPMEIVHCHLAVVPPLVSKINDQVPPMLAQVIAKLVAKSPEERYSSAEGLRSDLTECYKQWQQKHSIEPFQLGLRDLHTDLQISQKLYGREEQTNQLMKAFAQASKGSAECIFVSGYSGVGKTSLIKELQKPIVHQHGYFASGKFERLKRDIPYSALLQAFSDLINQVLREPEARFNQIKQQILDAMESNGQLIVDVLPSLELLIGKQPAVAELTLVEAQNRFATTLQNFIRVFAHKDHPLALLLDDLQWADAASLSLIQQLLIDNDTRYLLIIGAYRENEVDINHPLTALMQQLKKSEKIFSEIKLQPLNKASIKQLLTDTLNTSEEAVTSLADIVAEKTDGNPFFMAEFLKSLYQENLLRFDVALNRWNWDNERIKHKTITNNVVDLVLVRIKKLPKASQNMLKLAASLGANFSLQELAIISNEKLNTTFADLQSAVQANLIVPTSESYYLAEALNDSVDFTDKIEEKITYKFIHDRIQQAAYELVDEADKKKIHLQIARMEIAKQALTDHDDRLFALLNHYNYSLDLVTDAAERLEIEKYNYLAGMRAKSSAAYEAAIQYFKIAISLLSSSLAANKLKWHFRLYKELMECNYLVGDFEQAEKYFKEALTYTMDKFDVLEIYRIKMSLLKAKGKYEEGIETGAKILTQYKFAIPKHINKLVIVKELIKLRFAIGLRKIKNLEFKPATDKLEQALIKFGAETLSIAVINNPMLFGYLSIYSIRRALKYGYGFNLKASCLTMAIFCISKLNRYNEGMQWLELFGKLPKISTDQEVACNLAKIVFVNYLTQTLTADSDELLKSFQVAQECGKQSIANGAITLYANYLAWRGASLSEQIQATQRALDYSTKINDDEYYDLMQINLVSQRYLFAKEMPSQDQFAKLKDQCENVKGNNVLPSRMAYIILSYLFGHYDEALNALAAVKYQKNLYEGRIIYLYYLFYNAMALIENYSNVDAKTKQLYYKQVKELSKTIKVWSERNPDNFKFYYLLVLAGIAGIEGKTNNAMDLYDSAITTAQELDSMRLVALANECAGKYYIEIKKQKLAKFYLQEAHYAYQRAEVYAKVKQLELQYPTWLQATEQQNKNITLTKTTLSSISSSNMALDLLSAVKATQAISSEIELDKLLQKLLLIVLENAGGQRAVLMTKQNDDQWVVEAEGTREEQTVTLVEPDPIDTRNDLPLSLISYVIRSQKRVVVQDAVYSQEVLLDPYVKTVKPKSMLVMPILQQGQLKTILYLENNLISGAFTEEHINTLTLLASQAAISLENALLYYQATHDPLTGLANRNLLHQTFKSSLSRALRERTLMAVMFLDLDYFKQVNDTMGHEVGDKLLIHLSQQLKTCLREDDLAVRLGGDEFVALLKDIQEPLQAAQVAERLYKKLASTITINGHELNISTSIGISVYPHDGKEIDVLLQHADEALYKSKQQGRNRYQFYKPTIIEEEAVVMPETPQK